MSWSCASTNAWKISLRCALAGCCSIGCSSPRNRLRTFPCVGRDYSPGGYVKEDRDAAPNAAGPAQPGLECRVLEHDILGVSVSQHRGLSLHRGGGWRRAHGGAREALPEETGSNG